MQIFTDFTNNPNLSALGVLCLAIAFWILKTSIPSALKFIYDIRLEKEKRRLLREDRAFVISELIAMMQSPVKSEEIAYEINKRIFDLCLILPPCLIHKMAHSFVGAGTKEDLDHFGLLIEIRKFIDGTYDINKGSKLTKDNIPWVRAYESHQGFPKNTPSQLNLGGKVQLEIERKK